MENIEFLLIQIVVDLIVKKFKINYKDLSYILMYLYLNNSSKDTSKVDIINSENNINIKKDTKKIKEKNCKKDNCEIYEEQTHNNRNNNINNELKNQQVLKMISVNNNTENIKHNTEKEVCSTTIKEYGKMDSSINMQKSNKNDSVGEISKESILKSDVVLIDSEINDLVLGEVEFNEPVLKILSAKSEISACKPVCFKCENKKEGMLVYKGLLTTNIKYLKPKDIVSNGFCSESKYYTIYTPFEISKRVPLKFNVFKDGKDTIKDIKININKYSENICTEFVSCSNEKEKFKCKYKIINAFKYNVEILKEEKFKLSFKNNFKETG